MSMVIPMEPDEHGAVQALLPWYAKGQLGDAEAVMVQRHLLGCAGCRHELAAETPMRTLLNVAAMSEPAGEVEAGLAKLHARMRPEAKRATPRWMPWALGLQGCAVALLLGLWLHDRQDAPDYVGLSAAGTAPVVADALVMFKPGTSEQALRKLLQAEGASVVAGPTEGGAWLLRVDARGLAALRAAPIVTMAEPLQPGPAR
ncbi:zf-HC2 domain-containing protein [Pelomonas cellulosilytica]|uniref:Zf-HC2 domain-containing protein n=1 Tax=Pelomonas cellulosilytica TaxID=2906762 RepID=A0ABS8XUU6_9BURK|nr:zf-HC2 domain-containing protein [Pelomonas sp. P8]MCE4554596.1 zf-HC2 domain-containing protein [Pelomonas sp. P8]